MLRLWLFIGIEANKLCFIVEWFPGTSSFEDLLFRVENFREGIQRGSNLSLNLTLKLTLWMEWIVEGVGCLLSKKKDGCIILD